jgi:hypothetical protein
VALSKETYPFIGAKLACAICRCSPEELETPSKTGRAQTSRSGPLRKKTTAPVILFTGTDDVLDVTCRQMLACAGFAVLDVRGCKGLHR